MIIKHERGFNALGPLKVTQMMHLNACDDKLIDLETETVTEHMWAKWKKY